jgi:hypothetical protein
MFPQYDVRGAYISAIMELDVPVILPRIRTTDFRKGPALRECGKEVVDRSWGAIVGVPTAPDAAHGSAFVYLARTDRGWQPWYLWLPNANADGELIPPPR